MSNEFSIFGFSGEGVPDAVQIWLIGEGGVDQAAENIVRQWDSCDAVASDLQAKVYLLVVWHSANQLPVPDTVNRALIHILGLTSTKSSARTVSKSVMKLLCMPDVKNLDAFWHAARLDGEADAFRTENWNPYALARKVGVTRNTIIKWRKMGTYQRRREIVRQLSGSMRTQAYKRFNSKPSSGRPHPE